MDDKIYRIVSLDDQKGIHYHPETNEFSFNEALDFYH